MAHYSIAKKLTIPFDEAIEKTITAFKAQGFGVLTDTDVKATLKQKLNIDRANYRILGICNPPRAHQALEAEPEIGLLLPCNVIIYENKAGGVTVAGMRPSVAFSVVNNATLKPLVQEVEQILTQTINSL
jgi:uncharacterized protein (DUF302 family)